MLEPPDDERVALQQPYLVDDSPADQEPHEERDLEAVFGRIVDNKTSKLEGRLIGRISAVEDRLQEQADQYRNLTTLLEGWQSETRGLINALSLRQDSQYRELRSLLEAWRSETSAGFRSQERVTEAKFEAQGQEMRGLREAQVKLEQSTQAGFEALEEKTRARFETQEKATEDRFEALEEKTQARFEAQEKATQDRFDRLEEKTQARFEAQEKATQDGFERLEEKTQAKFEKLEAVTQARFEAQEREMQGLREAQVKLEQSTRAGFESLEKATRERFDAQDKEWKLYQKEMLATMGAVRSEVRSTRWMFGVVLALFAIIVALLASAAFSGSRDEAGRVDPPAVEAVQTGELGTDTDPEQKDLLKNEEAERPVQP